MNDATEHGAAPGAPGDLTDAALLDLVERRTIDFFWETAHPHCGMARDRVSSVGEDRDKDLVAVGGTGFGIMAIIAGVVASTAMLGTPAQAARCCKVMVCSNNACWEECRTCPKFP